MTLSTRILFPALACFGPLFMILGLRQPGQGYAFAVGGAFMVTGAPPQTVLGTLRAQKS